MNTEHIEKGSNTIFVVFSGFYKNKVNTSFEWNILRKTYSDVLFLKDDSQSWYLNGIGGVSTDVKSTTLYLNDVIKPYERVIFMGASMGGYASILYGKVSNHKCKQIHAFSPQISLREYSYKPIADNINGITDYNRFCDLSMIGPLPVKTTIYYGKKNNMDHIQISRMKCIKRMYDTDVHTLPKFLKENGVLELIIERILVL